MYRSSLFIISCFTFFLGVAQVDTVASYESDDMMGGNTSIQKRLKIKNQERPDYRYYPRNMKHWMRNKRILNRKAGVQFGVNYTNLVMAASSGITDTSETTAASGVMEFEFSWKLIRDRKSTGSFNMILDWRHTYGGDQPGLLGYSTGSFVPVAMEFVAFDWRLMEFFWYQNLFTDRIQFAIGKVDPFNYFTLHSMMNGFTDFLNAGFSVNPANSWPSSGAGIIVGFLPTPGKRVAIKLGLNDALGDQLGDKHFEWGSNFFKGKTYFNAEVVFTRRFEDFETHRISLTYWNVQRVVMFNPLTEEREVSTTNNGVALTANWQFGEKFNTFLAAGISNGGGINALADRSIAVGTHFFLPKQDVIGLGMNLIDPNVDRRNQLTTELYYRYQPSPILAITPSFQWIYHPSLDESKESVFYFGLRTRLTI